MYLHKKKTNGEVFYVGKGTKGRAWLFKNRNQLWTKIYEKYGCEVEILADNLQEWYAYELETSLIDYHGKIVDGDGTLANFADGGGCPSGEGSIRRDRKKYTFINLLTSERITADRLEFSKLCPDVPLNGLLAGSAKTSKNWTVEGRLIEKEIIAFRSKYSGRYGKRVDNKTYSFVSIKKGEVVNCTRHDLVELDPNLLDANLSSLIIGDVRTCKGWAMAESLQHFSLEHLANPIKGDRCGNADKSVYTFKNLKTGEIFEGTRSEFKQVYNIDVWTLFVNCKTAFSVKDWCLAEKEAEATRTSNRDRNVYSLQHKSGEVFKGTRMEFKEKFGYSFDKLVAPTKPDKTCKGWKLAN